MQRISVRCGEEDQAERAVLRRAFLERSVIGWRGFRVRVTAEEVVGGSGETGCYRYQLRLERPDLETESVAAPL